MANKKVEAQKPERSNEPMPKGKIVVTKKPAVATPSKKSKWEHTGEHTLKPVIEENEE